MTKIKRLLESTLHTGDFTYLQGEARTGVSYPVLEDILAGQYQSVVSTRPEAKGPSSLFYSLYEPTRAMHQLATDLFNNYLGRPNRRTSRDGAIWRLLRNIHAKISAYQPDARAEAAKPMPDIAAKLSSMAEGPISQSCLAVTAAAYLQTGVLHFRNSLAASVNTITLLVMHGVPRERVAYFGVYYQDPATHSDPSARWESGFYMPAPFHVIAAVYINGSWLALDFTRLAQSDSDGLPDQPSPYLRNPDFGPMDGTDAHKTVDYAHPYTMIFPPPAPGESNFSPLLKFIPLLTTS